MKTWISRHGPMIALMAAIFIVSSDLGSADHTRPVLASIVRRFLPWLAERMSPQMIDLTDFVIRKIAHVTEYAVLSLLVSRSLAVRQETPTKQRVLATIIASLYALSDEFHQSFVPSRGATYTDVMWDTLGATIGSGVLYEVHRRKKSHPQTIND
ncbi:MAG: VanZ family protein [Armatimonadaceae bacterium]